MLKFLMILSEIGRAYPKALTPGGPDFYVGFWGKPRDPSLMKNEVILGQNNSLWVKFDHIFEYSIINK
jgi:hypothetical protein